MIWLVNIQVNKILINDLFTFRTTNSNEHLFSVLIEYTTAYDEQDDTIYEDEQEGEIVYNDA